MAELTCEQLREMSAEIALEIVDGDDLAAASEHLQSCPRCRQELRELAEVADRLAALTPAVEPPPGFEARVLAATAPVRHRPMHARAWLGAAAAALVLVAGTGGWLIGRPSHHPGYSTRVLTADLYAAGRQKGEVLVSTAGQHWMSLGVQGDPADRWVTCQLEVPGGRIVTVGTFMLSGGSGYWAAALPPGAGTSFRAVRLLGDSGQVIAQANL